MPSLSEIIAWVTYADISRIIIAAILGYLVLLWISLIIWTTKDIISRSNNVVYQIISIILVVVLNIFGIFIYLGIRPAKTLIEKFFEDLEYETLAQASVPTPTLKMKENKKDDVLQKNKKNKVHKKDRGNKKK
ncbi:hypothetical protein C0416_02730 [bacterium]|nr:hypothetical protein [bacterium]